MPIFKGNTSGSILQVAANIPSEVYSFSIVNKTAGTVTVNVYVRDESSDVSIVPYNLSLAVGESYVSDIKRKLPSNASIFITTSGSVDYYFSIQ